MPRLSPVVMAQQAREFLRAAQREFEFAGPKASIPAYFLAARAIELGLKSFLLLRGRSERQLRAIGHDLNKALEETERAGIRDVVGILPEHKVALRSMNEYYKSKDLEYLKTGYKRYPASDVVVACGDRILTGLQPELRRWSPG